MLIPDLRKLAREQFDKHGLTSKGWVFDINDGKRRLGVCFYRTKRIEIASYYALHNSDTEVTDTLMHEIAHALVGPGYGHGAVWRVKARELGATPKACNNNPDIITPIGPWQSRCTRCDILLSLHRRPKTLDGWICKKCRIKFPTIQYVGGGQILLAKATAIQKKWVAVCGGCAKVFEKPFLPPAGVFCQGVNCGPVKGRLSNWSEKVTC